MDVEILTAGNDLVPFREAVARPETTGPIVLPALIAAAGDDAFTRFVEYFTAHLRNPHTRRAYCRNAVTVLRWCEGRGIRVLKDVKPVLVAGYIEQLQQTHARPSVNQHLATIRMLFDWLVTGQVVSVNPAHAVRGPRHVVTKGKTPALTAEEPRTLLDSITPESVVNLRDRALIGTMFFTFARVGAVVAMTVEDDYHQGRRSWLRLHEKGGKQHEMPANHHLQDYIDAYIQAAGIEGDSKGPLFRSAPRTKGELTRNPLRPADVWRMIRRRTKLAGIKSKIGCHSFRVTGITNYLEHDGTLDVGQPYCLLGQSYPALLRKVPTRGGPVSLR